MHWYVVQTHANRERKAAWHLQQQGFGVYLPQYLKRWRHARKSELRPAPLFPRYLFVSMDIAQSHWRAIRSTIGVTSLVCSGDRPAMVPSTVIDDIRTRENEKGWLPLETAIPLKSGDTLAVVEGGLSGARGFFECFKDSERVVMLLEMLGRPMRVQLPASSVSLIA